MAVCAPVRPCSSLEIGGSPYCATCKTEQLLDVRSGVPTSLDLAAGRGDVLLVGHEPDFSMEVGRLTGAKVAMKKGGIAVVDGSTLVALLRPKELRRIAG